VETPKHPSFPSGHSTVAASAATVLSYYFPSDSRKWQKLANEAGQSRIWGGLHFPYDHYAGTELGKKVAEAVLQQPFAHK
jgi:membrane-associated phospholipid phosphatase